MKAFVTGITGFAGSFLAEHLLACGDQALGCSRNARWPPGIPADVVRRVGLFAWDICQAIPAAARRRLEAFAPDCVYHLAALSVPRDCGADEPTREAWAINVEGTEAVIELAASLPTRPRLLLVSSCHVYAPVGEPNAPVCEDAPLGPVAAYGKTKLAAEQRLRESVASGAIRGLVARTFKNSGPRQNARLMLPEWCRQLARRPAGPLRVLNFDSYFDLTDVRDVVRAYRLLAARGQNGRAYNVGSGTVRRSGDLARLLCRIAGTECPIVELAPGVHHQPIADIRRLQRLTGWRPQIPLEKTLADTLAYWRDLQE